MAEKIKWMPPHSEEAEQYVLGCLLLDSSAFEPVQKKIDSSMFYTLANQNIYTALQTVFMGGIPVDIISVSEQMKKDNTFSDSGGMEYLNKLASQIVSASSAEYYASIIFETKKMPLRIETGFTDLDKLILGFQPGDFILIAARPSVGKSTLAMNMAQNMAIRKGKNVLFLSLEMSNEQLTDRIIASEARVSNSKLQRGEADQNEWAKVTATAGVIHESKIFLDDTSSITVADIRSKCRRFKSAENLDIIFIDYLQLIGSAVKKENRQQEVTEISRQLKILAKDMKIPVVALSQLSRASEQRSDHVPQLSDLRESGAIEQDADIVMFLYRPSQFDKAASTHLVDLVVAKNRNGSIGKVKLVWQDQIVKFDSYKQE